MAKRNELIAYAIDFVSYLISKETEINRVILHGSVARGDFDEESDVDIFTDVLKYDKKIENKINKITDDYYKTKKFKEWELKGIKNMISLITGNLDSEEWKDLKRSIMNTGIILYGKYKGEAEKIKQYTLFSFENIKPDKKRVAVFRKLFGFKLKNKTYPGIIEKYKGISVGKGAVLIPIESVNELKRYFQEKRISVKMYDLWSD
jgi:predicted nucleotidyltransferase